MRKSASKVIEAFKLREPCGGGAIWTDGNIIYSYKMKIAWREETGAVKVVSYASSPSPTTTSHIRDCLIGLGVSKDDTVRVDKPALTHKAAHGFGEKITSKKAVRTAAREVAPSPPSKPIIAEGVPTLCPLGRMHPNFASAARCANGGPCLPKQKKRTPKFTVELVALS